MRPKLTWVAVLFMVSVLALNVHESRQVSALTRSLRATTEQLESTTQQLEQKQQRFKQVLDMRPLDLVELQLSDRGLTNFHWFATAQKDGVPHIVILEGRTTVRIYEGQFHVEIITGEKEL